MSSDSSPAYSVLRVLELYGGQAKLCLEAKTTSEREAAFERLCTEMKENHPELIQGLFEADRSGFLLLVMSLQVLESIDDRKDLSQADKNGVASDAQEFMSIFNAVSDSPSGICPRELVFRFGMDALSLGLSAGLSPEKLRELRAGMLTEHQTALSLKGVESRIAKIRWRAHAEELAIAAAARDPNASNESIAAEIVARWKLKEVPHPGRRHLSTFITGLRTCGKLPEKTGSLPR
jgi:hypothetical protein